MTRKTKKTDKLTIEEYSAISLSEAPRFINKRKTKPTQPIISGRMSRFITPPIHKSFSGKMQHTFSHRVMRLLFTYRSMTYLTGSRAFGTALYDSDWDVIILDMRHWLSKIKEIYDSYKKDNMRSAALIDKYEIQESDYFAGKKIVTYNHAAPINQACHDVINLIPLSYIEFMPWILATEAMREISSSLRSLDVTEKHKSHALFMGMVSHLKGITPIIHNMHVLKDKVEEAKRRFTK